MGEKKQNEKKPPVKKPAPKATTAEKQKPDPSVLAAKARTRAAEYRKRAESLLQKANDCEERALRHEGRAASAEKLQRLIEFAKSEKMSVKDIRAAGRAAK